MLKKVENLLGIIYFGSFYIVEVDPKALTIIDMRLIYIYI